MNELAVVICNYNKKEYVIKCIQSVLDSEFKNFDIIVVDNASTDGSVEAVKSQYGNRLTILISEINTGGAGGFNLGMQYAIDRNYNYIHLLDNDVILDKTTVGALYRFMKAHPKAGACGSLVYRFDDPKCTAEMGAFVNNQSLDIISGYPQVRTDNLPKEVECDYVTACSSMYKVEALQKSGIMDPVYFWSWDDIDLSTRIRLSGYTIHAISAAPVWHHFEFRKENTTLSHYYSWRNRIYYFTKFLSDEEFDQLPEMLTRRLFRMIAVNRCCQPIISTHLYGLNDALNSVMGRAGKDRIVHYIPDVLRFYNMVKDKKNVLICITPSYIRLIRLISEIMEADSKIRLTILTSDNNLGEIENVDIISECGDYSKYDLVVNACYHVLDVGEYDRKAVYIDNYFNIILDHADFDFCENLDSNYDFFYRTFHGFIKSNLTSLRKELHHIN